MNPQIEKLMTLFNFGAHFIGKGDLVGTNETQNDSTGLRAHAKGKDQKDERITITAFARTIDRLVVDYGPESVDKIIVNRNDAVSRIDAIIKIINSYTPHERRCISMTIGLRQESVSPSDAKSSKKKGKTKKTVTTQFENKSGQDMIVMMALTNKKKFTKRILRMMLVDLEIKDANLKQTVQVAGAIVGGFKSGLKKAQRPERERFRSPWWLDLYPPGLRGPAIRKQKEAHNARMLALRTARRNRQ